MDQTWILVEDTPFDVSNLRGFEGLFTLGSGYLHVRGALEEHLTDAPQDVTYLRRPANVTSEQFPEMKSKWGTFIPGIYGNHPLMGKELANLPHFLGITPFVDGEKLDMERSRVEAYRRALDFHTATLTRALRWLTESGAVVSVTFERFVSAARPHLCVQRMTLTSDRDADLTLDAGIDTDVRTSGYDHFTQVTFDQPAPDVIGCSTVLDTGAQVDMAAHAALPEAVWTYSAEPRRGWLRATIPLRAGQSISFEKRTAVTTSTDRERRDPLDLLAPELDYEALASEHAAVWRDHWEKCDVVIEGDDESQIGLRLAMYHLLRSHPNDSRFAIDPKAYAGDAYRGLYFWDTEMYLLPFFLYTDPDRGRMLTDFRINTLAGARQNAADYGYGGARYPWEGDADGVEQCPNWQYRDHEVHVTADVVYGTAHYAGAAADPDYLQQAGEVLRETARYWLDRVDWRPDDGYPSLLGVMGPDEYTPISSNNAYTNRLVSLALTYAAQVEPDEGLRAKYLDVARRLPIVLRADGLVMQCEEFDRLAEIDIDGLWRDRSQTFAAQVSQERLYRSKCLKQADVLLLMMLFPHEFSDEEVKQAWAYYLPYTTHDSSLSPGVHALIALRLGMMNEAWALWRRSHAIDLEGGAEEGIHIAAAGMHWQIAVFGFGGLQTAMAADRLMLNPKLPPSWTRLAFPVTWKGQRAHVGITHEQVAVTNHSAEPLAVSVYGVAADIPAGATAEFDVPESAKQR